MILFAFIALVWSGLHAEPADAHENAMGHTSTSAASSHGDEDKGQSGQRGGDQHACHHHCPNAAAQRAPEAIQGAIFTKQPVFGTIIAALHPMKRAPPLDPPIS